MIPSDLAARLRTLTEASFFNTEPPIPGLQRARAIQSQLPELVPGQRFFATLQRTLPDGSFNAVVAGRQMTLALNTSAKPGDTLELEVTQTTPRAVFARVLNTEAVQQGAGNASAQPTLSSAGRLISFLLTGQPAPPPASLAGNRPLLPAPPATPGQAAQLVPLLRQAVGQSGLFYESHQVRWVLGKLDTAALLGEPQGQQSAQAGTAQGAPAAAGAGTPRSAVPLGTPAGAAPQDEGAAPRASPEAVRVAAAGASAAGTNTAELDAAIERSAARGSVPEPQAVRAQPIPERLLPVVHQQLDALATQHYVWHGQAWPGQAIEWEIEDPQGEGSGEDEASERGWNTTLRLHLPRLGGVEAQLHLTPAGVALRLRADDDATIVALDAGGAGLASALEAANLKLTGLVVEPRTATGSHG
jgi:hypothetical protein